jgi:predicted kinase
VLFDAIEFSETIATIDVLYDLAFLLMDLARRGQAKAANIVFNRYLDLRRAPEDLSGLAALPLFLATRAGVRALVTADRAHEMMPASAHGERAEALGYFRSALAHLAPRQPRLVCIGGFSGTGKSTLARHLAPSIGVAPGALHVRSDVERKMLAKVEQTTHLDAAHYTEEASARVYRAVIDRAGTALAAGHSVIVDAVFAKEGERRAAEDLARRSGATFLGIWLAAPPAILKSRVTHRHGDASDATADVVDRQLRYDTGTIAWQPLDASGSLEETLARAKERL